MKLPPGVRIREEKNTLGLFSVFTHSGGIIYFSLSIRQNLTRFEAPHPSRIDRSTDSTQLRLILGGPPAAPGRGRRRVLSGGNGARVVGLPR